MHQLVLDLFKRNIYSEPLKLPRLAPELLKGPTRHPLRYVFQKGEEVDQEEKRLGPLRYSREESFQVSEERVGGYCWWKLVAVCAGEEGVGCPDLKDRRGELRLVEGVGVCC